MLLILHIMILFIIMQGYDYAFLDNLHVLAFTTIISSTVYHATINNYLKKEPKPRKRLFSKTILRAPRGLQINNTIPVFSLYLIPIHRTPKTLQHSLSRKRDVTQGIPRSRTHLYKQ